MWSDLFLLPFLTGLCLALILPALGCFLRLRDEWLAALAYAHVAAAGRKGPVLRELPKEDDARHSDGHPSGGGQLSRSVRRSANHECVHT